MFSLCIFLLADTKIKEHVFFWVFRKKETFAYAIIGKICYVTSAINRAGQLICLHASLHERDHVGLIDKAAFKSQFQ